jgi:hypothetical protein
VYLCRDFRAVRAFQPNHDIAALGWFGPDELPADVDPGTARRVKEILGGTEPASRW